MREVTDGRTPPALRDGRADSEGWSDVGGDSVVQTPREGYDASDRSGHAAAGVLAVVKACLAAGVVSAGAVETSSAAAVWRAVAAAKAAGAGTVDVGRADDSFATCAMLIDVDRLESRIGELVSAFREQLPAANVLHCFAAKANPSSVVLEQCRASGIGVECASVGELELALAAGFEPAKIVFDAPNKTPFDLARCLGAGVHVNLDSIAEIDLAAALIAEMSKTGGDFDASGLALGVRVNTAVGGGRDGFDIVSTSTRSSKFGVCLETYRADLLDRFQRHPWLRGLHAHVGSQGCRLDLLVRSVVSLYKLAEEINALFEEGVDQVKVLDIGGGLPTSYSQDDESHSYAEYAQLLCEGIPSLAKGKYDIITEFGRSLVAKSGMLISRVETVKRSGDSTVVAQHIGANLMLRACYHPDVWTHRLAAFQCRGDGDPVALAVKARGGNTNIVGPMCFSGDVIASGVSLSGELAAGDVIAVRDCGGYTLSMYSRYNSLPMPAVWSYRTGEDGAVQLKQHSGGESITERVTMWK